MNKGNVLIVFRFRIANVSIFAQNFKVMDDKLEIILKGAAEVFRKYGFRSVSMDDICRELGISKKTLYQYVENKSDLIKKILLYSSGIHQKAMKTIEETGNAIDVLLGISRIVCGNKQNQNSSLIFELQKFYPQIYRDYQENLRELHYQGTRLILKEESVKEFIERI